MNWYYAIGGQQQGPVDEAQLDALIQSGQINQETLVWREGMASWQPLSQARTPAKPTAAPPIAGGPTGSSEIGEVVCTECGKLFAKDSAIQYGTAWVCATCKPIFLQKLREGTPLTGRFGSEVSESELLSRNYDVDIGGSVERAWRVVIGNFGNVLAASLLAAGVLIVGGIIAFIPSLLIPFANVFLGPLYMGPMAGGYLYFLLKILRGEDATVGDAFSGFSKNAVQLILCSLVASVANLICFVPAVIVGIFAGISGGFNRPEQLSGLEGGLLAMMVFAVLIGVLATVYLATIWTHSLLLIVDKQYRFWPAMQLSRRMVSKRWWMTFWFIFVAGVISFLGFLACVIGMIVSVPMYFAMRAALYDDNFRDLARAEVRS